MKRISANGAEQIMASKVLKLNGTIADATRCPVCLGIYKDPIVLSNCGHSLCADCLTRLAEVSDELSCPECRTLVDRSPGLSPIVSVRRVADAMPKDNQPSSLGQRCPHIGPFTKDRNKCPHCDGEFCNICQLGHMERMKVERKWVSSSFEPRLEEAIQHLEPAADKTKDSIARKMWAVRLYIERETANMVEILRRKEKKWLVMADDVEHGATMAINKLVESGREVVTELPELQQQLSETADLSALLCSTIQMKNLNDSVIAMDHKIYGLEQFLKDGSSFKCSLDLEQMSKDLQKEVHMDCKNTIRNVNLGSQSTEMVRLQHVIATNDFDSFKKFFENRSSIAPIAFSLAGECVDSRGRTPLILAADKGNVEMVRYLVEKCGSNVHLSDKTKSGDMAIHAAARQNHPKVVEYLGGVNSSCLNAVNKTGQTPIIVAAEVGSFEVLKVLAEAETVDVNDRTANGYSAVMLAVMRNHRKMVEFLIEEAKCDTSCVVPESNNCLLHIAVEHHCGNLVSYLRSTVPSLLTKLNAKKQSPLVTAAVVGNLGILQALLGDNLEECKLHRLLHWAAIEGHVSIGRWVIEKFPSEVFRKSKGLAPIHCAVRHNRKEFVTMLLELYPEVANLMTEEETPKSPLTIARKAYHGEIARIIATALRRGHAPPSAGPSVSTL